MVLSRKDLGMEDTTVAPVRVAVRIRPLLATDRLHEIVCAYATPHQPPQPGQVILGNSVHEFDHAFNADATQNQIFQTAVSPLMDQLLEGYDTSVVMYGNSNTGKTHTLFGPGVHCVYSEAEYGIIPRATRHIYGKLMKARNVRFSVKVTFLEVCIDSIRDLLATNQYQQEVLLDENAEGYPVIIGAEEVGCENVSEVFNCLHAGMNARQLAWNIDGYSVCHYIFQILVEQKWITPEGLEETRLSQATFADLGSCVNHSLSRESFNMDCGLIALNNVVESFIQRRTKDNSYQQSVLTRLLKESFGGRSYTLVISCISPASLNFDESLMTLRFADRVKNVHNTPKVSALLRVIEPMNSKDVDQADDDPANADTFRLEFAATQWYKLVHNAEGLFKTLVSKNLLSEDEKEQIEQWLCLKEECEEVVASDEEETGPAGKDNRLEKIDEVTETEDKTDSSKDGESPPKVAETCEEKESETESEAEERPDFHERLEEHMDKLRETMEEAVAIHEDILQVPENEETDSQFEETNVHSVRGCFPKVERRRSVDPETDRPLMRLAQQKVCSKPNPEIDEEIEDEEANPAQAQGDTPTRARLQYLDPQQQLKLLSAANEAKQHQIKEVLADLEGATNQLSELQRTIQIKEEFIGDMMKNTDTRTNAKQKCQRKRTKLTEAYYKIMAQLTQAQNTLSVASSLNEDKAKLKSEVEKYSKQAKHYDKRIKHVDAIKQIAADSAKRALELENSLQASKRQMEKLKQRLQRAEARKIALEQELLEDQHKIKELEDKFQQQEQDVDKEQSNASSTEGERLQWIQVEEERLMKLRESSQRFQEQLIQQQSILEKREAFLKEKICLEKQRNKSMMEVSARISHLDQVLKEKSTDLEHIKDAHEKEALRLEIHHLRSTRDCLIEQRCTLDTKFQKDKVLSTMEERKLLECDEAIEAIDAAIEYKNELICGRKGGLDSDSAAREKGEQMLMARLNKLSPMEMRMLLYKYFQKVIDLRETCRKMEVQIAEKELHIDSQMWHIHALSNLLKQQQLKEEQQLVQMNRQYQGTVNHFLRMFAEGSSTEGGASSSNEAAVRLRAETPAAERAEAKSDRRNEGKIQFRKFLGLERGRTPGPIPHKNLKTLQGSGKSSNATVTVGKNKLIIEQKEPRKPTAGNR